MRVDSVALVTFMLGLAVAQGCGKETAIMLTQNPKVFYEVYLRDVAGGLDCYFTIEQLADTATHTSPLSVAEIVPTEVESIDALVDKLNRDLEGVTATRSTSNPRVIHLVENALRQMNEYVMEREVTVDYTGNPHGLMVRLHEQLEGAVGPWTSGPIPAPPLDATTEISVSVEGKTLRDVLTGAVPLKDYSRFMWSAYVLEEDGLPYTGVNFLGPVAMAPFEEAP